MSGPGQSPAIPAAISRIVLTGFMGAGKTTAGAVLAHCLGWRFVDSDRVIEARAGRTIAQIFEEQGEAVFREMEAAAVRDAAGPEQVVVALGGGALETAATRSFLAGLEGCRVVYLEAPFDILMARCAGQSGGAVRPVLRDEARLEARWKARLAWYGEAHLTVATGGLEPEAVAQRILEALAGAETAEPGTRDGGRR